MFKRRGILLGVFVLGAMVALSMFYLLGTAGATEDAKQVIPIVTVDTTASLTIVSGTNPANNNAIEFGNMSVGGTQTKVLVLSATANDDWQLTVTKNQNMEGSSGQIPSTNLTFTSAGPDGPTYATSATQFGTGTPVVTNGTVTAGTNISVSYSLEIPPDQAPGTYSAGHTYTLTVGL